jgi:hypothetical protein
VRRWEWLMLIPNDGRLPHTSQTAAIVFVPLPRAAAPVAAVVPGRAVRPGGPAPVIVEQKPRLASP